MNTKSNAAIDQIQPAPGYLLIKPDEQETKTSSGIYLPDNAKTEKPQKGSVLAVGANQISSDKELSSPAQKGSSVIYKKWGGNEVKIDNVEYLFVKFEDILAVINK